MDCEIDFQLLDAEVMDNTFKLLGSGSLASREAEKKSFIRAQIICAEDLEEDSTRSWYIKPEFIDGTRCRCPFYFMLLGEEAKKTSYGIATRSGRWWTIQPRW